jgi:ribosome-interacting GTPase 1
MNTKIFSNQQITHGQQKAIELIFKEYQFVIGTLGIKDTSSLDNVIVVVDKNTTIVSERDKYKLQEKRLSLPGVSTFAMTTLNTHSVGMLVQKDQNKENNDEWEFVLV